MKKCIIVLFVLACISAANIACGKSMQLGYGISIEIPPHWTILSEETKRVLNNFGEELGKNLRAPKTKTTLIAANSPKPVIAMARISIVSEPDVKESMQATLKQLSESELRELDEAMLPPIFFEMERAGMKIFKKFPLEIVDIQGQTALRISYIRKSLLGNSKWKVHGYTLMKDEYLIEITLSYDLKEEQSMLPLLTKIRESINIES